MGEGVHNKKQSHYNPKNDTEGGLNRDQRSRVLDWENKHADDKYESLVAIDKNGRTVVELKGDPKNPSQVSWAGQGHKFKDAIISHNHPGISIQNQTSSDSIARSIKGYPFSAPDIHTAVANDALGIRARTGNYIFSIQRGKDGWGKATAKEYNDMLDKLRAQTDFYASGMSQQADIDRFHRTHIAVFHSTLKEFAKKHGLKYTRRKVR